MTTEIAALADLLGLFPPGSRVDPDGELVVGGCRLADLAATCGTPLYLIEEAAVRVQVDRFRRALEARWPSSRMVFASKAFPCTAMYRLMASEGIGVDVAGAGELAMALAGGVDPGRIVMHGNAKTPAELQMAVDAGVGLIVIDNTDDIDRLEDLVRSEQPVLVRVIPGVRPDTHEAVATGQLGSKFGLPIPAARAAIARLRHSSKLRLDGLHMHIGSQILSAEPYARAIEAVAGLGEFATYNLGGGLGVRYTYDDHPPSPEDWIAVLASAARRHLPRGAQIIIEPGRSLVAPFGVTLYRVISVKGDDPRFVAVDGGMADNMEVALYGQRFEATVASRVGGGAPVELVGRHCESGDRLISGAVLREPRPGDLIAMAVTGAYCYSLASNYNGAMRLPVVLCQDGTSRLVVRRETHADFLSRDVAPG
ncbi:MAG TPA: diaminopimelate decarboxylase [Streptosporangiaceae bacterium]|jgi:diaminopimelate decarboxylase|nr:diaminopimelate decarboxylase [Streptosporangiaceae bacterium]